MKNTIHDKYDTIHDMNIIDIKKEFPIFHTHPNLIYCDSAATSLTPQSVITAINDYYTTCDANVSRGVYHTSNLATQHRKDTRALVAHFLHAHEDEIIFTSGATASLNTIAHGFKEHISHNDTIITTIAEHHANFIPWQQLCKSRNAHFITIPVTREGFIDIDTLIDTITIHTKIITLTHVSNVFGAINPIHTIIKKIRQKNKNIIIVLDVAQSIAHMPINVKEIDCDFCVFSFHKMFGSTGIGVLYGKKVFLEQLHPLYTGGDMIDTVSSINTSFCALPHRLEAGTPHIAGFFAAHAAIQFIQSQTYTTIQNIEHTLVSYCVKKLKETFSSQITIYGPEHPKDRSSIISFTFNNYHPHDIATILDSTHNIAIRAGQHCAMPLHTEHLHIGATARISLSLYNTQHDIDLIIDGLQKIHHILS